MKLEKEIEDEIKKQMKETDRNADKCIHTGKKFIHYTDYKPNCKHCLGHRMRCEYENIYKPRWESRKK